MNKLDVLEAIIIEDDSCQVELLKQVIRRNCPNVAVKTVAKCKKGALKILKQGKFDIIFLDVNLGGDCAFELFEHFPEHLKEKELIVISSEKDYALEAFSYAATDYILKPIVAEDVIKAVEKAQSNLELKRSYTRKDEKPVAADPLKIIAISCLNEVKIIKVDEILYLKSDGNYTVFHTSNGEMILSSKNLGSYENLLQHNNFFRTHHSYLVNMNFVSNVQKKDGVYLEIVDQQFLPVSKRRIDSFYQYLRIK